MKKIKTYEMFMLILCFFSLNFLYASTELSLGNETKQYDKIFEKISETRVGIDSKKIDKIKNPFIMIYKKRTNISRRKKAKLYYRLDAIINNKAMINGKWRKKYSKIGAYKLVKIKKSSVLLRNASKYIEIFIRKNHEYKIKFSSK